MVLTLLVAAVLALRMAWIVLAEASHRRDARAIAAICAIDGATHLFFAVQAQVGHMPADAPGPWVARGSAILIAIATLELAHALPDDRAPSWRLRGLTAAGAAIAFALVVATGRPAIAELFALTCVLAALAMLVQRWRALRGTRHAVAVGLVIVALLVRLALAIVLVGRDALEPIVPGITAALVLLRRSAVPLAADVLVSLALLRSQLVDPSRLTSKLLLSAGAAVAGLILTALALDATLRSGAGPGLERALLLASACIPAVVLATWWTLGPRVEAALLDRTRATRREALEEVAQAAAESPECDEVIARACAAVSRFTGSKVRFLYGPGRRSDAAVPAPSIPLVLRSALADPRQPFLTSDRLEQAGDASGEMLAARAWDVLVPVRRGGALHGALVLASGRPDREALRTVSAIADQLAMRLDHEMLFADRIRVQAELSEAQRLAALGTFAAAVAHDIRTPLTSVQMNVQLLRSKVRLDPDDMEHFDIALEELGRLDSTAGAILEFAKPVQLCRVPVELDEVISGAIRALAPQLAARGIRVEREDDARPLVVPGDVQALRRVLQNLLSNAAEASPDRSTIRVRTRSAGDRVSLEVSDSGRGIRPEDLPRIFQPFYTTRAGGTGLGLAIVDRTVRAHGGEVHASSPPEGGAKFTVLLPGEPARAEESAHVA